MATNKSLASHKSYLLAQVREKNGWAHFQVRCAPVNRPSYGFAFDIRLLGENAEAMADLLEVGVQKVASQAGTNQVYIPCQIRSYGEGRLHVQVRGTEVNRSYGAAVTFGHVPEAVLEQVEDLTT